MTKPVRAITFDAGDTLVHLWVPKVRRFGFLCRQAGIDLGSEAAERAASQACELLYQSRHSTGASLDRDWWIAHNLLGLKTAGVEGDPRPLAERICRVSEGLKPAYCLEDGASLVLEELRRRGYRLAVVSNWEGSLEQLLISSGVRGYFDFVADSGVLGVEKPDPRIYRVTCEAMGVEPSRCVHVGDSLGADGVVAARSGASFVLYDPLEVHHEHKRRISRLNELLSLL